MAEVARLTGLPRASARRCLHTLTVLGYATTNADGRYELTPAILTLGQAYSSSTNIARIAQPILERVSDTLNESSSVAVLDNDENRLHRSRGDAAHPVRQSLGRQPAPGRLHLDGPRAGRRARRRRAREVSRAREAPAVHRTHDHGSAGARRGARDRCSAGFRHRRSGAGTRAEVVRGADRSARRRSGRCPERRRSREPRRRARRSRATSCRFFDGLPTTSARRSATAQRIRS